MKSKKIFLIADLADYSGVLIHHRINYIITQLVEINVYLSILLDTTDKNIKI